MNKKRKLWSIWKKDRKWKVQFPKGILTFNTKKEANKIAKGFSKKINN